MSKIKPTTEHEFKKAADLVAATATFAPIIKVDPAPLVGTWLNADKSTRGIVKVVITEKAGDIFIESFGACHPSPCPWGVVKGTAFSDSVTEKNATSFTAHYDFGFSAVDVSGWRFEGAMFINTFTVFKDNSGRSSYHTSQILYRP